MNFDDIKVYLPKFLSPSSEKELFEGLRDFPRNLDERIYTNFLIDTDLIYQGDGLKDLLVVSLPNPEVKPVPCVILSNTCDIDVSNARNFPSQMVYAPIFNLRKYQDALYQNSKKSRTSIDSHIDAIRQQQITQIFYLPALKNKIEESIVFFDRVNNSPSTIVDRKTIKERRLFTLSDYGAYLFLLKLSIHFTRIHDNIERKSMNT